MKVADVLATAKDSMTVSRVFGEPIERDGITVIAAATISGGGGAGEGGDDAGQGSGGGFGLGAKPVGAFVIKDGQVRWQPSVDVNRVVLVAGVVVVTALVVGARIARLYTHSAPS
ncbi:sporulation protein [Nocardia sp. CS682]|uniref:sporulation protein n=1 Tax=Nocardia sp. CS682 TaxID=1047172 RepID=UPI0010753E2C|nr:sporulation protein [Nocardia sp. CS682]QBS45322.1 sporulation protein [Nocardia sp. CS682]